MATSRTSTIFLGLLLVISLVLNYVLTTTTVTQWSLLNSLEEQIEPTTLPMISFKSKSESNREIIITTLPSSSSSSSSLLWEEAIRKADEILAASSLLEDPNQASCLIPNVQRTAKLLRERQKQRQKQTQHLIDSNRGKIEINSNGTLEKSLVPLPVLNMGFPKTGSTTLYQFFNCAGYKATHWRSSNEFEGICMRDAADIGLPPLKTCAPKREALLQMDVAFPFGVQYHIRKRNVAFKQRDECFFPQLSLLEEIHTEVPDATFVINFRPIKDWLRSMIGWYSSMERIQSCHLPNLPSGQPYGNFSNIKKEDITSYLEGNDSDNDNNNSTTELLRHTMTRFFCSHIIHLRNFVETHPTHALIELDLYDTNTTSRVMNLLFQPSTTITINNATKDNKTNCWRHINKSNKTDIEKTGKQQKRPKKDNRRGIRKRRKKKFRRGD